MVTVEQVRARYPNPQKTWNEKPSGYCVGGAFYMMVGGRYGMLRFPDVFALAEVLAEHAGLAPWYAEDKAAQIINFNDEGDFSTAWRALEEALEAGHQHKITGSVPE